jgi:hypothetical protein
MQNPERRPTPAIVFDSSIEDDIGRVLALAQLLGYQAKQEVRITSLSISRNNLKTAAFCELMARFFGASPTIGMSVNVPASTNVPPMLSAALAKVTPEGKPAYNRVIEKLTDTADPVALIRNALTSQQDQNSVVVLTGPAVNLLGLLALPEGKKLIEKKVRTLVVAAPFDAKLLADWPGPKILAGEELGSAFPFPGIGIEEDFTWATNHPLVDAYRAARPMPYDVPSAALAAVLYAAHPAENYFKLSEPQGKQRQLIADMSQKDRIIQAYRQVVSAKPPEPRRGARGAQP